LNWVFKQDGSFAFEAELAGEVLTKLVAAGREPRASSDDFYGTMVHPHIVGVDHQHWFNMRLDFDVDGPNNAVMENEVTRVAPPRQEPDTPYFTVTHRVFGKAAEAKRDAGHGHARTWTVYNASASGPTGRPLAYSVLPAENAEAMFPRQREKGPVGFTFHHLWVTPYRDGELYADGKYPNQAPQHYADTLFHYAGEESIYDRDVVVWYSLGETHVVRPEDYPLMSNAKLSVRFVPDGFFAKNPALGLAVEEGKSP
jgi:primary-amine oxidase